MADDEDLAAQVEQIGADERVVVEGILESVDGFPVPREVTPWPGGERCIVVTQWIPQEPEA